MARGDGDGCFSAEHGREDLGPRHVRPHLDRRLVARLGADVHRAVGGRAQLLRNELADRPPVLDYGDVLAAYNDIVSDFSTNEREALFHGTADRVFGLL